MTELRRHRLHQELITRAGFEGFLIRENYFLDERAMPEMRDTFYECAVTDNIRPSIVKEFTRLATDKNNTKPFMEPTVEKIQDAAQQVMEDLSVGAKLKVLVGGDKGEELANRASKAAYMKYVYFAIEDIRGVYHKNVLYASDRNPDSIFMQTRAEMYEKRMKEELLDQQAREIEAMIERDLREMKAAEEAEAAARAAEAEERVEVTDPSSSTSVFRKKKPSFSEADYGYPPSDPMAEAIFKSIEDQAMAETEAEFRRAGGYEAYNKFKGSNR